MFGSNAHHRIPEQSLFMNRVIVVIVVACLFWFVILGRLLYLQMIHYNRYEQLSANNALKTQTIHPNRGLIFDRNGQLLAQNKTTYQLHIVPEQATSLERLIDAIQARIDLTEQDIEQFYKQVKRQPSFASIPLKFQLSEAQTAILAVDQHLLTGMHLQPGLVRDYPHANALSHLVGYLGGIDENERETLDKKNYQGTTFVGKAGIEKLFETQLHGQSGTRVRTNNARGRSMHEFEQTAPVPGKNITLTIDLDLQKAAARAMANKRGAVIALSPQTGEILAMVSKPDFDPNMFIEGNEQALQQLFNSNYQPLFNRYLKGQYPPASTLKPIMALGGLHHQLINPQTTIEDPGWYRINENSRIIRDWQPHGHGPTNLAKAVRESCDTYFYDLAFHMGIDKLSNWLGLFGFGEKTGIELAGEKPGLLPNRDWKKQTLGEPWYQGETLVTIIGQGYLTTTPLQLAQSVSTIANRGLTPSLHVTKGQINPPLSTLGVELAPSHWQAIIDSMNEVTHHRNGTAYKIFKDFPYSVAGKTGTAQVFGWKAEKKAQSELPEHLRDHSLFIGFAPIDQPQIAVAVVLENQKGSAAIAKQIIAAHLENG